VLSRTFCQIDQNRNGIARRRAWIGPPGPFTDGDDRLFQRQILNDLAGRYVQFLGTREQQGIRSGLKAARFRN
jgi:hypothetical protein